MKEIEKVNKISQELFFCSLWVIYMLFRYKFNFLLRCTIVRYKNKNVYHKRLFFLFYFVLFMILLIEFNIYTNLSMREYFILIKGRNIFIVAYLLCYFI